MAVVRREAWDVLVRWTMSVSGEGEVLAVVAALRLLGYSNAYRVPVAPWLCEEPIVVSPGEFQRESRQVDGAVRGKRELTVHVCMDDPRDAEVTARHVVARLAGVDWVSLTWAPLRVLAGDVGQPVATGRDSSGRWLWDVPLALTMVAEHE